MTVYPPLDAPIAMPEGGAVVSVPLAVVQMQHWLAIPLNDGAAHHRLSSAADDPKICAEIIQQWYPIIAF